MSTRKVKQDPGSLDRQQTRRRRRFRKKVGAFAVAAAIGLAACSGPGDTPPTPADEAPTVNPPEGEAGAVGTVTFNGSTCSMEVTADRIEPGIVVFEAVNAAEQPVMFDSWQILEGYTFREFEVVFERQRRLLENGKPYPTPGFFPDQETEVLYLGSEVIPAKGSGSIVTTMLPGPHAIACGQRFEGAHPSLRGFQFFGLTGPFVVG